MMIKSLTLLLIATLLFNGCTTKITPTKCKMPQLKIFTVKLHINKYGGLDSKNTAKAISTIRAYKQQVKSYEKFRSENDKK